MESNLKLTIEKGPRKGETLEFTSRSKIRIGRVVKGNTIAIKDAGISSKHICIKFDCKWLLSDLDSSNGTFLNDDQLTPNEPAEINDGDTIKLGEVTSIKVRIESNGGPQVRMNLRKGRGKVETDVMESGEGDVEEGKSKAVGKPPRRGRPKKVLHLNELVDKACDVVVKVEEMSIGAPVSRQIRSTRNLKKAENVYLGMNESNFKELEKAVPAKRGGRCKRILQDDSVSENLDEGHAENLGHGNIEKNFSLKENLDGKSVNQGEECVQDKQNSVNLPSKAFSMNLRNSKKAENVDLGMNESNLKEPVKAVPAKRGGRHKRVLQDDPVLECLDKARTELPATVENLGHGDIEKNSPVKENLEAGKSVNLGEECGQDKDDSVDLPSEAVDMSIVAPVLKQTRSTQNSKKAENVDFSMNESKLKEPEKVVPAKRGGRRKRVLQNDPVSENLDEERTILPAAAENLGHGNIENSSIKENLEADKSVNLGEERCQDKENPENLPPEDVEMSTVAPVSRETKSTQNSKKAEIGLTMNEIDLKEPQRAQRVGRRTRILQNDAASKNLDEERTELSVRVETLGHETVENNSSFKENLEAMKSVNLDEEHGQDQETLPSKDVEMDVSGEKDERTSNIRQGDVEELATSSGVKENADNVTKSPDLEKMTLGHWFDYLEVTLPKQIHDEAEEMILEMRKKAAQFQEFMLQQKNAKA